ncbi:hypothetical protein B0H14DRAFT_2655268 [Mycena olivaceomarginata]|nr:hypothetical protein B0H14DRAFT_2655268 [Mycena olivaceomarginata]
MSVRRQHQTNPPKGSHYSMAAELIPTARLSSAAPPLSNILLRLSLFLSPLPTAALRCPVTDAGSIATRASTHIPQDCFNRVPNLSSVQTPPDSYAPPHPLDPLFTKLKSEVADHTRHLERRVVELENMNLALTTAMRRVEATSQAQLTNYAAERTDARLSRENTHLKLQLNEALKQYERNVELEAAVVTWSQTAAAFQRDANRLRSQRDELRVKVLRKNYQAKVIAGGQMHVELSTAPLDRPQVLYPPQPVAPDKTLASTSAVLCGHSGSSMFVTWDPLFPTQEDRNKRSRAEYEADDAAQDPHAREAVHPRLESPSLGPPFPCPRVVDIKSLNNPVRYFMEVRPKVDG